MNDPLFSPLCSIMKSATFTFSPPLSPRTLDGTPYLSTPSLNNFKTTSLLLLFLMPNNKVNGVMTAC